MLVELIGSIKYFVIFCIGYYVIFPFLKMVFNFTVGRKLLSGRKELIKYGKWAVVTGATDGIGKAYAHELAKDGMNIVLISRTLSKLQTVAREIENKYSVSTKIISVDFSKVDIYDEISKQLDGVDIGVLVNNVGVSYPHPIYFYDRDVMSDESMIGMINCNCVSVVMMMRIVLPKMVPRGKGGAIINIASFSGNHPVPLLSVYSSSKAFVDFLSRSVEIEIGNRHNIEMQSVLPLFVATKMSRMKPSLFVPTAESYVNCALDMINVESRTFGCFSHAFQAFISSLLPAFVFEFLIENGMRKAMNRAIKKKNKSN